jgi:hypothetical protein
LKEWSPFYERNDALIIARPSGLYFEAKNPVLKINKSTIMNPNNLSVLDAPLHAWPVMLLCSRKLLAEKSSVVAMARPVPECGENSNSVRATKMTTVLKSIQGYMQGGLND